MKNVLLASVAFVFVSTSAAFATMPAFDADHAFSNFVQNDFLVLAKDGGDDSGSDNSGSGSGQGGSGDDNDSDDNDNDSDDNDDDTNDDKGSDLSSSDDSKDDSSQSNSNRKKPRIPGGSGCDDAGDVAEYAECRAQ